MARVKQFATGKFRGIDRRVPIQNGDPQSLWDAKNVSLTRGGDIITRDMLRLKNTLPEGTVGLYSFGGKLRCVAPRRVVPLVAPVGFQFDVVSHGPANVDLDRYVAVHGVSSWGADSIGQPQPYLVLETNTGRYEHHYLDGETATRVSLGFSPGKDIIKLQNKLYAPAIATGLVHYSSTQSGPRDWNAEQDAGFVDAVNNSQGNTNIQGVTFYNSQLAVFFPDSIQFWQVDQNPNNFALLRTLQGPGTTYFGSVQPIVSDLYYFSQGGFHSLQAVNVLGEQQEGDIGAAIRDLTDPYEYGYRVSSFWSPSRSQYLCFFSLGSTTRVFVRTVSRLGGVDGWTYWDLDLAVDDVTELEGVTYIRSGNNVYEFYTPEPSTDLDYEVDVETMMFDAARPELVKQWNRVSLVMQGFIDEIQYRVDSTNPDSLYTGARNLDAVVSGSGVIPVGAMSHRIGAKLTSEKAFKLSTLGFTYFELAGAG